MFAAGTGNENPAHRLRSRAEKVRAILAGLSGRIHQLEPRFVNQRGRLERVAPAVHQPSCAPSIRRNSL